MIGHCAPLLCGTLVLLLAARGSAQATTPAPDAVQGDDRGEKSAPLEFAPLPDFQHAVDYAAWAKARTASDRENASEAYARVFAEVRAAEPFRDMFHDALTGPPEPWDAKTHPEWEASWAKTRALRERFRAAAQSPWYGTQLVDAPTDVAAGSGLLSLWPAGIGPENRSLLHSTIAAGWRRQGDRVAPEDMLTALETVALCTAHRNQGITLLERLVAAASGELLRRHARWALARGVFASEPAQTAALTILSKLDQPAPDLSRVLPYEHAHDLDLVQQVYAGRTPEGAPTLDPEAARNALRTSYGDDAGLGELALSPAEIIETVQTIDAYYREVARLAQTGYPTVRSADVEAAVAPLVEKNALTRRLFVSVGRFHALDGRAEAQRRATQLCFAIHLFHSRSGHWPGTLDELGKEIPTGVRVDPFSGRDFCYRLESESFRLYTVGENGKDDGGIHRAGLAPGPDEESTSDDFVFWPPQDR